MSTHPKHHHHHHHHPFFCFTELHMSESGSEISTLATIELFWWHEAGSLLTVVDYHVNRGYITVVTYNAGLALLRVIGSRSTICQLNNRIIWKIQKFWVLSRIKWQVIKSNRVTCLIGQYCIDYVRLREVIIKFHSRPDSWQCHFFFSLLLYCFRWKGNFCGFCKSAMLTGLRGSN